MLRCLRIRIKRLFAKAGDLGIGTTSPGGKLDIGGGTMVVTDTGINVGGDINSAGRVKDKTGFIMPVGAIMPYGGNSAPDGWLICNGSQVSRTTYADLFSAVSTAWGNGDGSTTFHLPDLRGRFIRGVDGGAGNDTAAAARTASNSGGNTGDTVGSVQEDAFQGHKISLTNSGVHTVSAGASQPISAGSNYVGDYSFASAFNQHTQTLVDDGTNGTPRISTETRPKNAYVTYIIKY